MDRTRDRPALVAAYSLNPPRIISSTSGRTSSGWTFAEPDGSPTHPRTFASRFERLVEVAGIRPIPLHGARHTSATLSLEAGERADVVAERLGHASVRTTLDVYAAAHPAAHRDAAARLGEVLNG